MELLLKLHDEAFIVGAYRAILDRAPDNDGFANYLTQLRTGADKARILVELAQSPEGRSGRFNSSLLADEISSYSKNTSSLWIKLLRRISNASSRSNERQLRILENRLYLVERKLMWQNKQIAELFTYVIDTISQSSSAHPKPSADDLFNELPDDVALPHSLGRTYFELKAAIARKQTK